MLENIKTLFETWWKDMQGPEDEDMELIKKLCLVEDNDTLRVAFKKIARKLNDMELERKSWLP